MPTVRINGKEQRFEAQAGDMLLFYLRETLGLTGAKYGCGEGQCGACTVLVEGRAVRSCITPLSSVAGKSITTIEGLAQGEKLHPVQQAFLDADALQCGYCTPGMIMSAAALLKDKLKPTDAEIGSAMQVNVCRCCTYPRIIAAVRLASTGGRA